MRPIIRLLIILFSLHSCSSGKHKIPIVNLQNPKTGKIVRLNEILTNYDLVKLETSKDILIGENNKYLVSDKFIITAGPEKIFLFSRSGKYIKTIASAGRGPDEYLNIVATGLDEKNNILYINQRDDPSNILAYSFLEDKPVRKFPTGIKNLLYYIVVLNDTLLAVSPGMNIECNFLYLSTSGRIIHKVSPPEGIGLGISISKINDNFYYKPKQNDTVFLIENFERTPICFLNVDNRVTLTNHEQGNLVHLFVIGSDFIIAQKILASSIQMGPNNLTFKYKTDKFTFYWIDKTDYSAAEITRFHNAFFGSDEPFVEFRSHFSVCNNYGFLKYSAFEFIQKFKKDLVSEDSLKLKTDKLLMGLNESDNPILLIGRLK